MDTMRTQHIVRCRRMAGIVVLLGLLLSTNMTEGAVGDPTATLSGMTGSVFGTTAQEGRFAAEVGTILQGGDAIETLVQSSASLSLSEGSTIALGENTKMEIAMLIRDQVTTARRSRVKLLAGHMRAELSAGHQDDGAAFSVETPNTLASVKFSRPVIEVTYDPLTDTTTIDAYTVDVVVTNLRTMRTYTIPAGSRGVIHRENVTLSELATPPPPLQSGIKTNLLWLNRTGFREAATSVPTSVGTVRTCGDVENAGGCGGVDGGETNRNPPIGGTLSAEDERRLRQLSITIGVP